MRITYFGFAIRHLILVIRYKLHPKDSCTTSPANAIPTKIESVKKQLEQKMQMSFGTLELSERLKRDGVHSA